MYTYPEIKLQNKQDAFCAMYHNICRSIFALCGAYEGEGVIRSAVRAAGEASGAEQLKKLTQAKACTDLSNLYRLGTDIAIDPQTLYLTKRTGRCLKFIPARWRIIGKGTAAKGRA